MTFLMKLFSLTTEVPTVPGLNNRAAASWPGKVRGIKVPPQLWQITSSLLRFDQAQGDVVITMDADLQDSLTKYRNYTA